MARGGYSTQVNINLPAGTSRLPGTVHLVGSTEPQARLPLLKIHVPVPGTGGNDTPWCAFVQVPVVP